MTRPPKVQTEKQVQLLLSRAPHNMQRHQWDHGREVAAPNDYGVQPTIPSSSDVGFDDQDLNNHMPYPPASEHPGNRYDQGMGDAVGSRPPWMSPPLPPSEADAELDALVPPEPPDDHHFPGPARPSNDAGMDDDMPVAPPDDGTEEPTRPMYTSPHLPLPMPIDTPPHAPQRGISATRKTDSASDLQHHTHLTHPTASAVKLFQGRKHLSV